MVQAKSTRPELPRLTGIKKRQQIEVAGRVMFVWIVIAAVAVSFCVATGQYLFNRWVHNNKIIAAKNKASDTLGKNIVNSQELKQNVDALVANQALASVKTKESDQNTKSVLDALPSAFDSAALGTSLQQAILSRSGATIESISVPQDVPETQPLTSTPQEMKFSFVIAGSYKQIQDSILDIERTIRPIKILTMNLTGSDTNLRASIEAVTYYQPAKKVQVGEEVVK
ncbi:MAG TPA: hypothetical protein VFT87_03445 [Candidatus Saccharimonadales bacterium]|nr:hypothetical protein [Candidatus Saccharimonadales bacterium]